MEGHLLINCAIIFLTNYQRDPIFIRVGIWGTDQEVDGGSQERQHRDEGEVEVWESWEEDKVSRLENKYSYKINRSTWREKPISQEWGK